MSFFLKPDQKLASLSLAVLFLLSAFQDHISAQSGRRTNKTNTAQPTTQKPAETETALRPLVGLQHQKKLLLGRRPTARKLQSEDTIFATFLERLAQDPNIVATSIGDVKREEAVARARSQTEAAVVLLSFAIDSFQNGTILLNSSDLVIDYEVLAPRTGKKLMKGKIYFQTIGGGRLRRSGWPGGTPIRITAEAAGLEVADLVHDWLRLQEMRERRNQ